MDFKYCLRMKVSTMYYDRKIYSVFLHICCISEIIHNSVLYMRELQNGHRKKGVSSLFLSLQARDVLHLWFYTGILLKVLFPCEVRILTPNSEQPTHENIFWDLFPAEYQYHPLSLHLKHNIFFV